MKTIRLKNAKRQIAAARDGAGVPHVSASNWLDALYGLGYMHAIDRGTQLLFSRSVASGRAAEEISDNPELLETDRFLRKIGLYRDLELEFSYFSPESQEQIASYCDGVNDGLESYGRSLPMWATGFQPTPWEPSAVILVGQLLSFGGLAISQLQNERLLVELIHAGVDEEGLRELFAPRLDDVDFDLLQEVTIANQLSDEALEVLTDLPRLAGSNAWVVSPWRSATGSALVCSDPHLEINRLPAIWYESVLRWDDQYVMGATLPGCPLFAVARTNQLGWGVTYMKGDTIDYFIEDCRQGETGWQYRRGNEWCDFHLREESMGRKGNGSHTMNVYENAQGIIEGDLDEAGAGLHLSIAWSGSYPGSGRAIATWLEVVGCAGAAQAMDTVRSCTQPTLCWMFADRDGHIGMQVCGRFPRRGGNQTGLTPIPAWDTKNHWQGWLPLDLSPRLYDPPCGFIVAANEDMNPANGPLLQSQPLSDYRKRRIVERLGELDKATLEDMQQLQYDVTSVQARELLEIFLPHMPDGDVKTRMENWDCSYGADSEDATLFQRLYRNVMVEVFGHEEGVGWRRMLYLCSRAGFSLMVLVSADRLLRKEESRWWRVRNKSDLIRAAAERLERETDRPWSQVNYFHFTDRFFGGHQVGRLLGFNSRRYPMIGCHATPFQGHVLQTAKRASTFAPSYHFVADLGTDEAWTNLPGGPNESRFSKYYNIDVPRWFAGEYKRLVLE